MTTSVASSSPEAESITLMSGALNRVLRRVTVDPGYSVDVSRFAGVAFLDSHTVMALSENKSHVVVRENDAVDRRHDVPFLPGQLGPVRGVDAWPLRDGARAHELRPVSRLG